MCILNRTTKASLPATLLLVLLACSGSSSKRGDAGPGDAQSVSSSGGAGGKTGSGGNNLDGSTVASAGRTAGRDAGVVATGGTGGRGTGGRSGAGGAGVGGSASVASCVSATTARSVSSDCASCVCTKNVSAASACAKDANCWPLFDCAETQCHEASTGDHTACIVSKCTSSIGGATAVTSLGSTVDKMCLAECYPALVGVDGGN